MSLQVDDADPLATASINLWRTPPRDRTSAPLYWPKHRDRRVSGGAPVSARSATAVGSVTLTLQLEGDAGGALIECRLGTRPTTR